MGCDEYWAMIQTRLICWRLLLITWGICRRQVGLSDKAGVCWVSWEKRHYWHLERALLTARTLSLQSIVVEWKEKRRDRTWGRLLQELTWDLRSVHSNPLISVWKGWEGPDDWVWVEIHLESFLFHQVRLNAVDADHDEVDKDQSD